MSAWARERRAVGAWCAIGCVALLLLPWHGLPGQPDLPLPGALVADPVTASALWQAILFRQPGLALGLFALAACLASLRCRDAAIRGRILMAAGFGGAAWLLACAIVAATAPRLPLGWGAAVAVTSLLVLGAFGLSHARPFFGGDLLASAVAVLAGSVLVVFVAYPLLRGMGAVFISEEGATSLALAWARVSGERIWSLACLGRGLQCGVAWNTLLLAFLTAAGTTLLGSLLALAELRSGWRFAGGLRLLAPLPFVLPPFVAALALILILGRSGVVSQALESTFGIASGRWLYGLPGLWLAQLFAFTPIAYLIVRAAVAGLPPAAEEAGRTLGASPGRNFRRVTLPLLAPALAHAFLVGFLESVGDFGSPMVVGGNYVVLATDIFFAIVGAQFVESGRAAGLAWVLALFALSAFSLERVMLGLRHSTGAQARGAALAPVLPVHWRRAAAAVALPWAALTLCLYACAIAAAFVEVWGRDFQPTLRHVERAFGIAWENSALRLTGQAWPSLFTSLKVAFFVAPLTALGSLAMAWLLQRNRFPGRATIEFATLMAFAVPGTVVGLSYTLVFNRAPIELTGTLTLIVLCLVLRNLPVAVGMASTAFQQLDHSLEEAARVLGASSTRLLRDVVLPLLRPALASSLVYSFVRSMTTVSAVVFLVTPETEMSTTYIIGRVGQGDYGMAFAYSALLAGMLLGVIAASRRLEAGVRLGRATRPVPVLGRVA